MIGRIYIERLENFFTANSIDDADKKKAMLLHAVSAKCYKIIRNLLAPTKPSSSTHAAIKEAVRKHFDPKPSIIVQRYKFFTYYRKPSESISEFVAHLRDLAQHCENKPIPEHASPRVQRWALFLE